MTIERYSPCLDCDDSYDYASMREDKTGDYVKYKDYAELLEKVKDFEKKQFFFYVFRKKGSLDFICRADTLEKLQLLIDQCYWSKKAMQSKGVEYTKEIYVKDKSVSKITIEDIEGI